MGNLFKKTKTLKTDLFSFKNEPLSGLSVFLLIVLDIFIFSNVMLGIRGETAKSPAPNVYYPYSCTEHFDAPKTAYDAFDLKLSPRRDTYLPEIAPDCRELQAKIARFTHTPVFEARLAAIRAVNDRRNKNNRRLEQITKQYNTRLFEQIANMPNNKALQSAKKEYDTLQGDNQKLDAQEAAIPPITTLEGYADYREFVTANKERFNAEKKAYAFWQPFNEFGRVLIFILPLLAVFGFVYYKSKRKELRGEHYNPVVKIIATHISLILSLPLVWYLFDIIYHVIPKTLLRQLIDFLIAIGLLAILNYLAIAAVVLVFGLLIYWIQKQTLAHKKVGSGKSIKKIVSFSECPACSYRVDYNKPFCPFCGTKLLEACTECGNMTIGVLPYCRHCGVKRLDEDASGETKGTDA